MQVVTQRRLNSYPQNHRAVDYVLHCADVVLEWRVALMRRRPHADAS